MLANTKGFVFIVIVKTQYFISPQAIIRNISNSCVFQISKHSVFDLLHGLFNELLFPLILLNFQVPEKAGCCQSLVDELPKIIGMNSSLAFHL